VVFVPAAGSANGMAPVGATGAPAPAPALPTSAFGCSAAATIGGLTRPPSGNALLATSAANVGSRSIRLTLRHTVGTKTQ
jgi:hypothetical protein